MAYYYKRTDELYHHGILGQKWGIRRFQNKDGSLTPAGLKRQQKEEKKARHEKAMEMLNEVQDYADEYDKTPDGSKKLKEYNQAFKSYSDPEIGWGQDPKIEKQYYKAEEEYLRGSQRYQAEKLVKKYGAREASMLWNEWGYSRRGDVTDDAKTFIKQYEDEWRIHAL